MKKKHKNSKREIVAQFKNSRGDTFALISTHASRWSVIQSTDGRIIATQLPRVKARKEYERLRKIFDPEKI